MKKVFVTGSAGFIGKHLMRALGEDGVGYDLKNDQDIYYLKDLERAIKKAKPDVIIHLAAVSNRQAVDRDPETAIDTNITGTLNVLEVAKKLDIKRVIVASSAATDRPDLSLYGMTKQATETLAVMYPNAIIARFYNVYGLGGQGVVNKWVKLIKQGKPITMYGNTTRDYIYVGDVVVGLLAMANRRFLRGHFEIGTGRGTTLKQLYKLISKELDQAVQIIQKPGLKEIKESKLPQSNKLTISLKEGIGRLVNG